MAVAGVALSSAAALLLSVTSGMAGAAGNEDCPPGTVAFKIEPVKAGTYTQAPYTVTLHTVLESTFGWTASHPVHTLIVKGGSEPAVVTAPGGRAGVGTAPPSPSGNGQLAGLSNVTFCFAAETTASPSESVSSSPSPSESPSESASSSPSPSLSESPSESASSSPSPSPSESVSGSPLPSATSSPFPSASVSASASTGASATPSSSASASPSVTGSPVGGTVDSPATGGGGATATPSASPIVVEVPISGTSTPLPATGSEAPLPPVAGGDAAPGGGAVAPEAVVQPGVLPFTGLAVSAVLLLGLVLLTGGTALAVAGRCRPAHAVPGFWSR